MRILVAMTGATGAIYGVRRLEALRELDIERELIVSKWAVATLRHETDQSADDVRAIATRTYRIGEMDAPPSSGSYRMDGMVIVPCSMNTLGSIASGVSSNLIHRSADVAIKERRPLVLVPRETPLSAIHLESLLKLSRLGVTIMPPVPAFYNHPKSIDDLVDHLVGRVLDQLGIENERTERWSGIRGESHPNSDDGADGMSEAD